MALRIECLSIDAADPSAQAHWWAEALGWRVTDDDDDEVLITPLEGDEAAGLSELLFIKVPEGKAAKNRLHLDLRPDDQAAEVARFEQLGARRIDVGQSTDVTWVVVADPEGNEFCILQAKQPD